MGHLSEGGGSGGGAPVGATYLTATLQTGPLPNSRQLLAGAGITLDASVPGELTISSAGAVVTTGTFQMDWDHGLTATESNQWKFQIVNGVAQIFPTTTLNGFPNGASAIYGTLPIPLWPQERPRVTGVPYVTGGSPIVIGGTLVAFPTGELVIFQADFSGWPGGELFAFTRFVDLVHTEAPALTLFLP